MSKIPNREIEFKKLKEKVEKKGGFLTIYMKDLRDAYGVGKLGPNVNTGIDRELRAVNLGHTKELTESQWDGIRLYQIGHPAEELVNAFNMVDVDDNSQDKILINACQSSNCLEYREALITIRDVVAGTSIDE